MDAPQASARDQSISASFSPPIITPKAGGPGVLGRHAVVDRADFRFAQHKRIRSQRGALRHRHPDDRRRCNFAQAREPSFTPPEHRNNWVAECSSLARRPFGIRPWNGALGHEITFACAWHEKSLCEQAFAAAPIDYRIDALLQLGRLIAVIVR